MMVRFQQVDPKKLMPQALKPVCGEETIIAREIRLQKEREEEIQKERLEARRKAEEKIGHLSSSTGNLLVCTGKLGTSVTVLSTSFLSGTFVCLI